MEMNWNKKKKLTGLIVINKKGPDQNKNEAF